MHSPMNRFAMFAATATFVLATGTACGTTQDGAGGACPDGGVRFGIEPYEDPAKLTPAYRVLADALQRKLDCNVELKIVDDYAGEVLAMRNEQLELAQFGPLGYVFASRKADAEPLASFADAEGRLTTYTGGIWVPKSSGIRDIENLRGRTLALGEVGSTSGDALPRYALRTAGLAEQDVKIDYAGGHPEALLALTNGKVDAAEINSQQLAAAKAEGTFDESRYRRIWQSEPIPNDPITVRGNLAPEFKERLREALLDLSPSDIAKVGRYLDVDPPGPLVEVDRKTYRPLFRLADTLGLSEDDA
ncbi:MULTISPECIES: phosphate/phosphite/phosphonate ABC transporter substrate-binding protein [Prauserella salsuginis group]|uniref:Phosphate/phosphite/phosphonate ABC transporter substrate-binding protein n=1 Tax=Prauserella salsuginis TaxID=387889 RepID=A0ABW6G0B9_9PSEU|nr:MULTISPECIES: phosphate/phosphite/phosphonate ABC transporter substrate-binding protein [Prauserella salsuginis group]MCR3721272.1 phosphonate transport system substrate-binding protein [Prauserella flava]MCR3734648.1 phosphonate transport system substrate-binding protein [Prauserella salsuginis]